MTACKLGVFYAHTSQVGPAQKEMFLERSKVLQALAGVKMASLVAPPFMACGLHNTQEFRGAAMPLSNPVRRKKELAAKDRRYTGRVSPCQEL